MLRVALFTDLSSADPFFRDRALSLIYSLAACGYLLRVYTSFDDYDLPKLPSSVEILRPFKSWSVFEAAKVAPILIEQKPDLLVLAPPPEKTVAGVWRSGTSAWLFLAGIKAIINPAPKLIYFISSGEQKAHHLGTVLLAAADLAIVPTKGMVELIAQQKNIKTEFHENSPTEGRPRTQSQVDIVQKNSTAPKNNREILFYGSIGQYQKKGHFEKFIACLPTGLRGEINFQTAPQPNSQTATSLKADIRLALTFFGDWGLPILERKRLAEQLDRLQGSTELRLIGCKAKVDFQKYQTQLNEVSLLWLCGIDLPDFEKIQIAGHALAMGCPVAIDSADLATFGNTPGLIACDSQSVRELRGLLAPDSEIFGLRAKLDFSKMPSGQDRAANQLSRAIFELHHRLPADNPTR
jgi:hypothetical protein